MAYKCNGDWDSWVFTLGTAPAHHPTINPNDGVIVVHQESSTGDFSGEHQKPPGTVTGHLKEGKCKDSPKHHINFKREEGNCKYHYWGDVTREVVDGEEIDVVRNGRRRKDCTGKERKIQAVDEDWVAEKTT